MRFFRTVALVGFGLFAFIQSLAASEKDEIQEFLSVAVQCDPGWTQVKDSNNPSSLDRSRTMNKWAGTEEFLTVQSEEWSRTHDEDDNTILEIRNVSILSAPWAQIDHADVWKVTNPNEYQLFWLDKSIAVNCKEKIQCVTVNSEIRATISSTQRTLDISGSEEAPSKQTLQLARMFISVCDSDTRDKVIEAINRRVELTSEILKDGRAEFAQTDEVAPAETSRSNILFAQLDNRDVGGEDIKTLKEATLEECVAACRETAKCAAYSFDNWNRFCFLKSQIGSLRLEPRSITGIRSNLPTPVGATGPIIIERYRGKRFPGEASQIVEVHNFEACEKRCDNDRSCIAFTFEKKDRSCRMFERTGEYVASGTSDSGAKRQAP